MSSMDLSVVVTNYNGLSLLQESIPRLTAALKPDDGRRELILVDDASQDESAAWVREHFPAVTVYVQPERRGFIPASNLGVAKAQARVVFLLNNDIIVSPDFFRPIMPHFDHPEVFAVAPYCLKSGSIPENCDGPTFLLPWSENSLFFVRVSDSRHPLMHASGPMLYASGGYAAFDREKFLSLGGFDELFAPFYWEDSDLGYNAWRRGWQIIYEPQSRVTHIAHATISRFYTPEHITRIFYRNFFFLLWKNLTREALWCAHLLECRDLFSAYPQEAELTDALLEAIKGWERVINSRKQNALRGGWRRSDQEIIAFFADYLNRLAPETAET